MSRRLSFACLVLSLLLLTGCVTQPASEDPAAHSSASQVGPIRVVRAAELAEPDVMSDSGPITGLQFTLSQGEEMTQASTPLDQPPVTPLSPAEIEALLRRLPPLTTEPEDVQQLALPPTTIPPPRTGASVQEPFPPPATPPPTVIPPSVPLEVLRYSPEGDVPLAPNLSVTFNQPMVALTGLQDLASAPPPVKLSPLPPGQWRWVGTNTVLYEPDPRFPMATIYSVEVPAGTKSATGSVLQDPVTWTFTTPPPSVLQFSPSGEGLPLDPLMVATFDQRINPDDILAAVKVRANNVVVPLRLATPAEVDADKAASAMVKQAGDGRWVAFRAKADMPAAANVTVAFGPGLPSAEGPLETTRAQEFTFRTHGPLTIVRHECGWNNNCPPLMPWNIEFSNPLDSEAFDASQVTISPELPNALIQVFGNTLQIQGRSQGRTTYNVRLSETIRDLYGQTLGADQTVTFSVGAAEPAIYAAGTPFVVLDPAAPPAYSIFTVNFRNLEVKAYAVEPKDWQAFQLHLQSYYREENPTTPPGKLVLSRRVPVEYQPDKLVETPIDLSPALTDGKGQLVLIIKPETAGIARILEVFGRRPPTITTWVQATGIGLDAFVDGAEMVTWANALADGKPLAGVQFELLNSAGSPLSSAVSAADGTAVLTLPASQATVLVARGAGDIAMLPAQTSFWGDGGWSARPARDGLRWHVFDDRGMYRPGEEVHVKGWIRRIQGAEGGDVSPVGRSTELVSYRVLDPQGSQLGTGTAELTSLSGFDLSFMLPEGMNLGYATLELTAPGLANNMDGATFGHVFQVQEFRRPEFEVKTTASEGPHFVGDPAELSVTASYFAGGPLPNAEVNWEVRSSSGEFAPPGWDDFAFGVWIPWWVRHDRYGPSMDNAQMFTGRTDAAGVHRLRIDFDAVNPPEPSAVVAQATVMDVNRQAWTSQANLLVHPAALYVGLRSDRMFVEREEPLPIEAIVTDLDGRPAPGTKITLRAARMEWRFKNGTWLEVEVAPQTCTVTSELQPVRCTFETPEGGSYRIFADITDKEGRRNRTQIQRWVSGGNTPPPRRLEQEEVVLIPDRKDYQPGDTAEILVQSPFTPAEGVLTLRRSGILSEQRFSMSEPTTILRIPVEDGYIPNLHVQVDLVGSAARLNATGEVDQNLPARPAFATGQLNLTIPPLSRTLAVTASPRDEKLEPGGATSVDISVLDATGKPVRDAEVAVVVVDEAILALSAYQLPDPVATFYTERSPDASDYRLRSYTILGQVEPPQEMFQSGRGGGPGNMAFDAVPAPAALPAMEATVALEKAVAEGGSEAGAAPIALRTDFNPLAVFAPEVITDAAGKATVEVKLPDNLTRYRVMVTAVADAKYFGKAESAITARLPLMVRPSPPRFLNFGDRFELPIVLQNQTDNPLTVDVAVRAANVVLTGAAGVRVDVPANDRVEVRFPTATAQAGTARFQAAAASGKWSDAAQFELPVWTPATTEAFATYGTLDEGAVAQPVIAPSDVFTQFGSLEITTSSTALQELTDAVLYLTRYPFECSEQIASRVLSIASLRDVLSAFSAEGLPPEEELNAAVIRDIKQLTGMQNDDGGFPIWRRGDESWPFHSVHATNALQRASAKGYAVSPEALASGRGFLRQIESHFPSWYSAEARRAILAYALNVRWQMDDPDPARARKLMDEAGLDNLSPEAIGWILPVLSGDPESQAQVAQIRRHLNNRVTETAGAAHFVSSYGDQSYVLLHSDRRADGVILDALIIDQPRSDLIPKLVRGLLSGRDAGRWANTQENVFILLALDNYFNTFESVTPDFVARMWLGDTYVGETAFRGRSTDYREVDVPMSYLVEATGPQDLILSKEGAGRLYYRLGLRYAPRDLNLPPADYGFTVERTYEAVDDPADVRRDATGTWFIKSGAKVKVRLTMVAPARRYHVALVDPIPAGLEALNPALAVTGDLPDNPDGGPAPYGWWWWGPWYEHQNLRDERSEAFTSLLWDGVYTYTYYARATTPGEFYVPPAKAEEMYAPETFGRSATDRVIVQ